MYKLGIDVGGTNTDAVLVDENPEPERHGCWLFSKQCSVAAIIVEISC